MGVVTRIEDPHDPRVVDYVGLTDAELRRGLEQPDGSDASGRGTFIAEGSLVLPRLIHSRFRVRSVLITPARLDEHAADLDDLDAPIYLASQQVMNAVAGFNIHRGVLASAERLPWPPASKLVGTATRVVIAEDLNDHENLGVMFRNAAGLGIKAFLLSPHCADPLYRRCVRVSMGHVLEVPFARAEPWPEFLTTLQASGFVVVGLTPDPSAADIRTLGLPSLDRVAFVVGAEGPGLSAAALERVGVRARIAMMPGVDSLNVAAAAAIAFHAGMPLPELPGG